MYTRPAITAALAAALVVALPATSAAASTHASPADPVNVPSLADLVRPPATLLEVGCDTGPIPETFEEPSGGGGTELEMLPPHANFTLQPLARIGTAVEVILDESTGDITYQQLCVERPGGAWYFTVTFVGQPSAGDWVAFSVPDPGTYTVTLTVHGFGESDRLTDSVYVFDPSVRGGP